MLYTYSNSIVSSRYCRLWRILRGKGLTTRAACVGLHENFTARHETSLPASQCLYANIDFVTEAHRVFHFVFRYCLEHIFTETFVSKRNAYSLDQVRVLRSRWYSEQYGAFRALIRQWNVLCPFKSISGSLYYEIIILVGSLEIMYRRRQLVKHKWQMCVHMYVALMLPLFLHWSISRFHLTLLDYMSLF